MLRSPANSKLNHKLTNIVALRLLQLLYRRNKRMDYSWTFPTHLYCICTNRLTVHSGSIRQIWTCFHHIHNCCVLLFHKELHLLLLSSLTWKYIRNKLKKIKSQTLPVAFKYFFKSYTFKLHLKFNNFFKITWKSILCNLRGVPYCWKLNQTSSVCECKIVATFHTYVWVLRLNEYRSL